MPKKLYLFIHFFNKLFVIVSAVYFKKHEKIYTEIPKTIRRGQSSWSSQYLGVAAILVRGHSILMTAMDTKLLFPHKMPSKNDQIND